MTTAQSIATEVRRRIVEREWRQGDRIPDEADLATEFGAARATVNKALQLLADEGLLDRRRRAGTRVAAAPVRKATFTIPIIREQITKEAVADCFKHFLEGEVERWDLPGIHAVNFLLHDVLGGGGIASLRQDPQGKAYAQMLLDYPVQVPKVLLGREQ